MNELTDRQLEFFNFIVNFIEENGYPPTLREAAAHFGLASTFGIKRHLDTLIKKGYIAVDKKVSRGISIVKKTDKGAAAADEDNTGSRIPIVGRVAAGSPITAIENLEGSIVLDPAMMRKNEKCFALRVKGDSMINAGIFEGDLVVVAPTREAFNGDIVVAMLEDEVTVKRFEKSKGVIRLIPENEKYEPIICDGSRPFSMVGKVVGVIRWM